MDIIEKEYSIEAARPDGLYLTPCSDADAQTFVILYGDVEVMRASTRALARQWVDSAEEDRW